MEYDSFCIILMYSHTKTMSSCNCKCTQLTDPTDTKVVRIQNMTNKTKEIQNATPKAL